MPSSIRSIFVAAGLEPGELVEWGRAIPALEAGPTTGTTGVYVVAVTADLDGAGNSYSACPLSCRSRTLSFRSAFARGTGSLEQRGCGDRPDLRDSRAVGQTRVKRTALDGLILSGTAWPGKV
jgi:hypothetical protein